jgi:hypothetical protein
MCKLMSVYFCLPPPQNSLTNLTDNVDGAAVDDEPIAPVRPGMLFKQDSTMWASFAADRFMSSYDSSRSYASRDDVGLLMLH